MNRATRPNNTLPALEYLATFSFADGSPYTFNTLLTAYPGTRTSQRHRPRSVDSADQRALREARRTAAGSRWASNMIRCRYRRARRQLDETGVDRGKCGRHEASRDAVGEREQEDDVGHLIKGQVARRDHSLRRLEEVDEQVLATERGGETTQRRRLVPAQPKRRGSMRRTSSPTAACAS
jgi:hypothetical protein